MKLSRSLSCLGGCLVAAAGLVRAAEPPAAPPGFPGYAPAYNGAVSPQAGAYAPLPPQAAPLVQPAGAEAPAPDCPVMPLGECPPFCPPPPCETKVLGFPIEAKVHRPLVPPMFGSGFPGWAYRTPVRSGLEGAATATRVVPVVAVAVSDPGVYFNLSTPTQTANIPLGGASVDLLAPLLTQGSWRIAENESPQPQNRVFFNYNYFRDVNGALNRSRTGVAVVRARLPGVQQVLDSETARVVIRAQNDLISLGLPISIRGRTSTAVRAANTSFVVSNVPDPEPGSLPPVFPFPFIQDLAANTRTFVVGQSTQAVFESALFQSAGGVLVPTTFVASPAAAIVNPGAAPPYTVTSTGQVQVIGVDGDTVILAVAARAPRLDVHLGTVGFEKTFADDRFSLGLRVPIFGIVNDGNFDQEAVEDANIGDLSVIFKYALLCDRASGSTLSAGVVATAPTGQRARLSGGDLLNATLVQPFLGWVVNTPSFYVQGFSSYVHSFDNRVPDLMLNDLGVGWWLYRTPGGPGRSNAFSDRELPPPGNGFDPPGYRGNAFADGPGGAPFLSGIVPTLEAHANTPVEGRTTDLVRAFDSVVVTGGTHFLLYNTCNLGIAFGAPVTGPRAFDWGLFAQLNVNY